MILLHDRKGAAGTVLTVFVAPFRWILALLLLGGAGLSAQEPTSELERRSELLVQGTVRETGTGQPIPLARLRLVPLTEIEGDTLQGQAEMAARSQGPDVLSDAAGAFRWDRVLPGRYQLEVTALGYRPLEKEVRIQGAPPVEIRVELVPEALALEPVVVVVLRSPRLHAAGFYQRREQGGGRFMDREEIERRGSSRVTDLVRGLAGVQIQPTRAGQVPRVVLRGGCRPDIVVDGMNLGPNISPDDVLSPGDLEGIEVHSGASAPAGLSRGSCGMLVFWTADPAVRGGTRPWSRGRLIAGAAFVLLALLATR